MKPPKLSQEKYTEWNDDFKRLHIPQPTKQQTDEAQHINALEVLAMQEGCMIRLAAMSGGGLDLMLNAAKAVHLYRYIAIAGKIGGWMDADGKPITDPPLLTDPHLVPPPERT